MLYNSGCEAISRAIIHPFAEQKIQVDLKNYYI